MCEECERELNDAIMKMAGGKASKRKGAARLSWLSEDLPTSTKPPSLTEIHRARHGAPPPMEGMARSGAALPGGSVTDGGEGPKDGFELSASGERIGGEEQPAPKALEMRLASGQKTKSKKAQAAPPAPVETPAPPEPPAPPAAPEAPPAAAAEPAPAAPAPSTKGERKERARAKARAEAAAQPAATLPDARPIGLGELVFGHGAPAAFRVVGFLVACAAVLSLGLVAL